MLTSDDGHGNIAAATVNWITQTAFGPPLLVVAVKAGSGDYTVVKSSEKFILNTIGKDQKGLGCALFKPPDDSEGKISGSTMASMARQSSLKRLAHLNAR